MKRDPALIPLSHDHHHALAAARRLRVAADGVEAQVEAVTFLRFFAEESVRHFREEEERLFPLVVDHEEAQPLVVKALLEHQQLHAMAARLASGEMAPMGDLAGLLDGHVRFEERELFPLIERLVGDGLSALEFDVDRDALLRGRGPVWGSESEDLNATLLVWGPSDGPPEHVNDHRDVLLVVLAGLLELRIDDETVDLAEGEAMIVAKGRRRRIIAGGQGVRYLSVHRRRPPLQIGSA
jgi:mannose-6-phosphate isomerase-like protein (cupin superfamily)